MKVEASGLCMSISSIKVEQEHLVSCAIMPAVIHLFLPAFEKTAALTPDRCSCFSMQGQFILNVIYCTVMCYVSWFIETHL
jgi:hypothetical protein